MGVEIKRVDIQLAASEFTITLNSEAGHYSATRRGERGGELALIAQCLGALSEAREIPGLDAVVEVAYAQARAAEAYGITVEVTA